MAGRNLKKNALGFKNFLVLLGSSPGLQRYRAHYKKKKTNKHVDQTSHPPTQFT